MNKTPTHCNVYFRMTTPAICCVHDFDGSGHSFTDQQSKERFYEEVCGAFTSCGWEVVPPQFSNSCPTVKKGGDSLYLYPAYFSGIIRENLIREVEALLANGTIFKHERTDVYERYVEMSDDEYRAFLESQKAAFEKIILDVYTPIRSNLCFHGKHNAGKNCQAHERETLGFQRLAQKHSKVSLDNFCDDIFERLIRQGRIITCQSRHGTAYRAVKPTHAPRSHEQPQHYGETELGFTLEPTPQGAMQ